MGQPQPESKTSCSAKSFWDAEHVFSSCVIACAMVYLLTITFKGWLVPCNGRKVLPDPLQHVFTLLYAREEWWFLARVHLYFGFRQAAKCPNVPFRS